MRRLRIIIVAGLVLPNLVFASVAAEGATTATSPVTSSAPTVNDAQSIDARVKLRKTERNTKLSAAQLKRLPTVCKAAQGKAAAAQARVNELQKSRPEIYTNLLARLASLASKLQANNVDTKPLQAEITSLQSQVEVFKTDLTTYQLSVNDLVALNCLTDPTGFQASLDAARDQRDKLQQESTAIKAYVTITIKPTLKSIHDELARSDITSKVEGKK